MSILIKEYDLTKPARDTYNNFSVVVPGFVKEDYNEEVFDANGIYEVDNQKDFINNVGCVEEGPTGKTAADARAAESDPLFTPDVAGGVAEPYTIPEGTDVYEIVGKDATKAGIGGYLVDIEGNIYKYKFTCEDATEEYSVAYYKLTDEGADAVIAIDKHLGNQLAFELLGLGYTVLYKKIDELEELEDADFWEPLKDRAVYDFRYVMLIT